MGSVSVSSCRYCMFVSCASSGSSQCCVLTISLLMLVEDARGDHIEEVYSRSGLMTAL